MRFLLLLVFPAVAVGNPDSLPPDRLDVAPETFLASGGNDVSTFSDPQQNPPSDAGIMVDPLDPSPEEPDESRSLFPVLDSNSEDSANLNPDSRAEVPDSSIFPAAAATIPIFADDCLHGSTQPIEKRNTDYCTNSQVQTQEETQEKAPVTPTQHEDTVPDNTQDTAQEGGTVAQERARRRCERLSPRVVPACCIGDAVKKGVAIMRRLCELFTPGRPACAYVSRRVCCLSIGGPGEDPKTGIDCVAMYPDFYGW